MTTIDYKEVSVYGRIHVVRPLYRDGYYNYTVEDRRYRGGWKFERSPMPQPNYHNTGMALCGVLKSGQTLHEWIKDKNKRLKERLTDGTDE